MSIVFLNGSGELICDDVGAGQIEIDIAKPSDRRLSHDFDMRFELNRFILTEFSQHNINSRP